MAFKQKNIFTAFYFGILFLFAGFLSVCVFPHYTNAALINSSAEIGHYDGDGNQTWGDNASAGFIPTSRGLNNPSSACVNTHTHYLFVADSANQRILAYALSASNNLATTAATYVLGQFTMNYQSGAATTTAANNFGFPLQGRFDIECDSVNDRLFVSDSKDNRVMVFDVSLGNIANDENATYIIGQTSTSANSATTTQSGFSAPSGLAYDPVTSRLFVADATNNRVLVFNAPPNTNLNATSAINIIGHADYVTVTGGATAAKLNKPAGVDYSTTTKQLFVADTSNHRVLVFAAGTSTIVNNENASYVLGQPDTTTHSSGTDINVLNAPSDVSYDPVGARLFVADKNNSRVMVFDVNPGTIATGENALHVLGEPDFLSQGNIAAINLLSTTNGVFYDYTTKLVYAADNANHRVMVFNGATASMTDGENASYALGHTDMSNNPQYTASYSNNYANPRNTYNPHTFVIDSVNHRAFISEYGDRAGQDYARISVKPLDSNNHFSATTTGINSYVLGWADMYTVPQATAATTQFGIDSAGLAYDSANQRLFVADTTNNRVMVFDVSTSTMSNYKAASYYIGQASSAGTAGATTRSGLNGPTALVYDSANTRLFVIDSNNNRVMVYSVPTASNLTGINATNVLGQVDYTTATASTTQRGLNTAITQTIANTSGLDYDSIDKRLFVPDVTNNRVMIFDANPLTMSNGEMATNILGQSSYVASTSNTTRNGFRNPAATIFDPVYKRLFVSDYGNNRTMIFNVATTSISDNENAQAMIGQSDFVSSSSPTFGVSGAGSSINGSFDPSNNVYFDVQYAPDMVRQDALVHITTTSLASAVTGSAYSATITGTSTQGTSQTFSIVSGSLPSGMTLNSSTGVISGTTLTNGVYSFVVEEDDNFADGSTFFDRASLSITVTGANIVRPSVSTGVAGSLSTSTATLNGQITSDGGASTTVRGFAYSTDSALVTGVSTTTENGTFGISSYTYNLAALSPGTTYYFRSYSVNIAGTSTGSVITFTTSDLPVVATPVTSAVTTTSGSSGGTASSRVANLISVGLFGEAQRVAKEYNVQLPNTTNNTNVFVAVAQTFSRTLQQGSVGADVKTLQMFLNSHGFIVSKSGPGSPGHETNTFGPSTKAAVIKFQKYYATEILTSNGLKSPTGVFGPASRKKVGELVTN